MRCVPTLVLVCAILAATSVVHAESGYFDAGVRCAQLAARKQRVQVVTGATVTFVDVPLPPDAAAFTACMTAAGHPPPKIDPEQYTAVARGCLRQAGAAADRDAAYGECVRRGIVVEALPDDEAE